MTENHNNVQHLFVGRFNPYTIYHADLIASLPPRSFITTTLTEGNDDNPISFWPKFRMLTNAVKFGQEHNHVVSAAKDMIEAIRMQSAVYNTTQLIIHCGDDRAQDYLRLNTYTEPEGIRIIDVVSIERQDIQHSGTYLRQLAVEGRFEEFHDLCGYIGFDKRKAYSLIRKHYGCI